MKNILIVLSLVLLTQAQMVSMPESLLTSQQKLLLKTEQATATVKAYTENAKEVGSLGREVGIAMREGFTALSDGVNNFGKTDAGKYVAFVIAWKFMATDIINILEKFGLQIIIMSIAVLFFFIISFIFAYSYYRTCVPRRILLETTKTRNEENKLVATTKKYIMINDLDNSEPTDEQLEHRSYARLAHLIGYGVLTIICFLCVCA